MAQRALARVNVAAIARNVARLRGRLGHATELCAVVKADGYGHGAAASALAALEGGATWLAVATAEEAVALRDAGVGARLLVLGALVDAEIDAVLHADADVVAWDESFLDAVLARGRPARVHVKLDTGLGRLGTRSMREALAVAARVIAEPGLELAGAMTHFATADDDLEFAAAQLAAFTPFAAAVRSRRPDVTVHAANSAAALRLPDSYFDLVRCGVAIYGLDPMQDDPRAHELEPALALESYVAAVKATRPGESAGYGRRFIAERDTWIATVPIGYGDGVRRALTNNGEVLIGGHAFPVVGTVSMDNITVEVGTPDAARVGDRVTLIGGDAGARITAEAVARRLGTINYEVVCTIGPRVPRMHHRDGAPLDG
jgi:alanine racemase